MRLIETGSFPIADIDVGSRLRAVDALWADGLAKVIEQTGLQNPIQIMQVGNSFRLVAGAHRLAAFKRLGRQFIPANVYGPETDQPETEMRLQEIVENVARRELSPLDRAAHIAELKASLHRLYGEKRGGDRKTARSKVQTLQFWSLGADVAARMGLSERTIFADAALHEALPARVRDRLSQPQLRWLAENRAQLVQLSREKAEDQMAVLDLLEGGEAAPDSVPAALALHFNKVDVKNPEEAAMAAFIKLWSRATPKVRKRIRAYIERGQGR
jgi:ParB family chromosome partitioning protein